jgi:preprotein translocase subunit SecA
VPEKVDGLLTPESPGAQPDYDALLGWVNMTFPLRLTIEEAGFGEREPAQNAAFIIENVKALYEEKIKGEHPEGVRELERYIVLNAIDRLWQDHLYAMDGLREGIHLVGLGQKDPLVEYKKQAFALFEDLMANIKLEILHNMFRHATSLQAFEQFLTRLAGNYPIEPKAGGGPAGGTIGAGGTMTGSSSGGGVSFTHGTSDGDAAVVVEGPRQPAKPRREAAAAAVEEALQRSRPIIGSPTVGRNDPCPCGSGKKYKQCHGRPA